MPVAAAARGDKIVTTRKRRDDPVEFDGRAFRGPAQGETLEVKTAWGSGKITNGGTIILVLGFLALGAITVALDFRRERAVEARVIDIRAANKGEHTEIVGALKELVRQQRLQTYVLALPEAKRAQLRLDEPEELRRSGGR